MEERAPHPNPLPAKKGGERERREPQLDPYTNSETSPAGNSNSNVFSVIDTMV